MDRLSMSYSRTRDEIEAAAYAQLRFLSVSAQLFDQGSIEEACRMASAVYVLVGRGPKHHDSICDSLGTQASRAYRSSVEAGQNGLALVQCNLTCVAENEWTVEIRPTGRGEILAGRDLPFDDWWSEVVVHAQGYELSRGDVVTILRNKGGGAHFDVTVNEPLKAAALRGDFSFQYVPTSSETPVPVPFLLENCMRQIADELDFSFRAPDARERYAAEYREALANFESQQAKLRVRAEGQD